MTRKYFRTWAGILAVALLTSLIPATASAAPGDECEAAFSATTTPRG